MNPRCLIACLVALFSAACAGTQPTVSVPVSGAPDSQNTVSQAACEGSEFTKAGGCVRVMGDLRINGTDQVDLRALSSLRSVSGTLFITNNEKLTSLKGLEQLEHAQSIVVANNSALTSVSSLSSIKALRNLTVANNPALAVLSGSDFLSHLDGLVIVNNGIRSARGFESLVSVGDLVIAQNPELIRAKALSSLEYCQNVDIEHNPRLAPTSLLESLREVSGQVILKDNKGLVGSDVALRLNEQLSPTTGYIAQN